MCSLYSQLLLTGRSKRGYMIMLDLELIMMLLDSGAPQWHTALMAQGKVDAFLSSWHDISILHCRR